MTRRLCLALAVAAFASGCADDASEGGLTVRDLDDGRDLSSRVEVSTIQTLTLGERWCEIGYLSAGGEMQTVHGYRSLCSETDQIGQEVVLSVNTFGVPGESCEAGDLDCTDVEMIEVVNSFLDEDVLTDTTAVPEV